MTNPLHIRRIALLVVLLSVLASGLYGWQLSSAGKQLRAETLAQAELRGKQLNGAVAEQIALLVRHLDFAAQELATLYTPGKPEAFAAHVRQIEQRFPDKSLLQVGVIDAKGYLAYSSLGSRESVFLGDREHFKAHLGAKQQRLFVSQPVFGRVSKQWTIQFTRPIVHHGRFAGVIVLSLSPDYLHKTLAALSLASDDAIAIYRQDGAYLARNRDNESALGKNVGPNRAFVGPDAAPSGSFRAAANFDQVVRIFQWQRLSDYPITVVLGLSEKTLLKPVEDLLAKNRWQAGLAAAILCLLAFGIVTLLLKLNAQQKLILERAEQLRTDEARLRAIYEVLPVGIALTDRAGHIIDCNPASEKLLGIGRAEQLAHDLEPLTILRADGSAMPPEEYASVRARKEGIAIRDAEIQLVTPQGNVWLQVSAMPINERGFGVVIAYADISPRKQMEKTLRDSEKRFRNFFEKNSSVMLLIDPVSGAIIDANATAAVYYGYSRARLIGMPISEINTLPLERIAEERQHALHEERSYFLFLHRLASGEVRDVEVHSTPIESGGQSLLFSIVHDITGRKQAEAELLRSNSELEQFSYSISHDMRQPLRMISSYLQLLEKSLGAQLNAEQREFFNFAIDGAQRLDQMLLGLLDYSRVGRKGEPPVWIESRALLDEARLFLQPTIDEAQAEMRIEGEWPRLRVSPDEMLRLLQNLLANALKFRVAGRRPAISVTSQVRGEHWRFSVADNGVGIPPAQIGRLFQVFQRLQSRADYEGTGIGLALCRKIAEHHGGRIWVESEGEGLGSRFCVELPLPTESVP